jgi:hypothetical protein
MKIVKIDKDTVKITSESEEVVKIPDLEKRLEGLKLANAEADRVEDFYVKTEESLRPYIMRLPRLETSELEEQIQQYRKL